MSFKEDVLNQIGDNGTKNLNNELAPFIKNLEKARKRNDEKWERRIQSNIRGITLRLNKLNEVLEEIDNLNWSYNCENVKDYLSSYGTFCNRYTMFYNKTLEALPIEQAAQIILFEYFNSIQSYYAGNLTEKKIKETKSVSLICMFHLGQIEETKLAWYSQSMRQNVFENFIKKYPNCKDKYITFEINTNAAEYLFNKMIFNDPKERLGKVVKTETSEILEVDYCDYDFMITAGSWKKEYYNKKEWNNGHYIPIPKKAYFEKGLEDGQYKKVNALRKIVRDNKDYINIAKKLSQT